VKYLVIDEADRIINDSCFENELNMILNIIPKDRTTYLFSATLTKDAKNRKDLFEDSKVQVVDTTTTLQKTIEGLEQKFLLAPS